MKSEPMKPAEIARRLGVTIGTFYRNRKRYMIVYRMPAPMTSQSRAYDRASMEAWLTRNDPRRPKAAANDAVAPPMPNSDAERRDFLHRHYERQPAE